MCSHGLDVKPVEDHKVRIAIAIEVFADNGSQIASRLLRSCVFSGFPAASNLSATCESPNSFAFSEKTSLCKRRVSSR